MGIARPSQHRGTNTTSLGTFSLDPVSEAANAATGSVGWSYALNNAAAQYLAAGQSVTETYTVTVNDGHGSTPKRQRSSPSPSPAPTMRSAHSTAPPAALNETNAGLTAVGTLTVTDADHHTASRRASSRSARHRRRPAV